jgi:hypothetical protein
LTNQPHSNFYYFSVENLKKILILEIYGDVTVDKVADFAVVVTTLTVCVCVSRVVFVNSSASFVALD